MNQRPRLLITGASGYLGRQLCLAAHQAGFQVTATARRPLELEVPCRQGDLLAPGFLEELLETTDLVLHCAAVTRSNSPEVLAAGNEQVVERLVGLLAERPQTGLVFFSTDHAIGPIGAYGASKAACERLISERLSNYLTLRLGAVLGDFDKEANSTFSKLAWQLAQGPAVVLPRGGRFPLPVTAFADLWALLLPRLSLPLEGPQLVNAFEMHQLRTLLEQMGSHFPRKAPIVPLPLAPLQWGARVMIALNLLPQLPWVGVANIGRVPEPKDGAPARELEGFGSQMEKQIRLLSEQVAAAG